MLSLLFVCLIGSLTFPTKVFFSLVQNTYSNNPFFKDGTERGCQNNAGGRSAMWIQDSFVDINKIGSTGHSMGGNAAIRGADFFGKESSPKMCQ
mgnify:CR=1 FL=1